LSVERWALKIGIYGGTFDPIHYGHLILGQEACESLHLVRLLFVPAAASPLKKAPVANAKSRLAMLRAAIEGEPAFAVDDCELRRAPPSYAIDTVSEIRLREPGAELFWLIGDDNVESLPRWRRFDDLKELVRFVVLDRSGSPPKHSYPVVRRKIDISSTEIRNRVASGRSIRYLVPPAVEEIIRRGNFYRESK
jgi:nicotinate-nucleotide adenylyltransferase